MEILAYMQAHWVEWLFAAITALAAVGYRNVSVKLKEQKDRSEEEAKAQQTRTEAVSDGVEALLRENIVSNYNKYASKGYCPIYAKESIKKAYHAYEQLGGNDVAKGLYEKLLAMPEEKERDE